MYTYVYPEIMEKAIVNIANNLNKKNMATAEQETNIFKILNMVNHEIRHAAFLDFLMDPKRNIELANTFWRLFLKNINNILDLSSSILSCLKENDKIQVNKIRGAKRYSEIDCESGNRIDYATELSINGEINIIVIEYKQNGTINNDFVTYENHVMSLYPELSNDRFHFFLIELGHKKSVPRNTSKFSTLSNTVIIDTCKSTLIIAEKKDMHLTTAYIKQYLEILCPHHDDMLKHFNGQEAALWDSWNPLYEGEQSEQLEKKLNSFVKKYIGTGDDADFLNNFHYCDLYFRQFNQAIIDKKISATAKHNNGWLRICPINDRTKNLWIWTAIESLNGELYLQLAIQLYQPNSDNCSDSQLRYEQLLKLISELFTSKIELDEIKTFSELSISSTGKTIKTHKRRINSNSPYSMTFRYNSHITINRLKELCINTDFKTYPEELELLLNKIKCVLDDVNQNFC